MVQVVNFEKAKGSTVKNTMVSVPSDLVQQVRKAYPEINLSATVRRVLQELLDGKPSRRNKKEASPETPSETQA